MCHNNERLNNKFKRTIEDTIMPGSEKKTPKMSPRAFLDKANAAKSAEAFLAANWEYLTTGEVAEQVKPFIIKLQSKTMYPTSALQFIKEAVFNHMLLTQTQKVEEIVDKASKPEATKNKPYIGVIYAPGELVQESTDEEGNKTKIVTPVIATKLDKNGEEVDLKDAFDSPQAATRWVQRRLAEGSPDWRGEVIWSRITSSKTGLPMTENISYDAALGALHKKNKSPFMHLNKVNGRLTGQMKVGQTKMSFSKG